jgi:hypothetical protein
MGYNFNFGIFPLRAITAIVFVNHTNTVCSNIQQMFSGVLLLLSLLLLVAR